VFIRLGAVKHFRLNSLQISEPKADKFVVLREHLGGEADAK